MKYCVNCRWHSLSPSFKDSSQFDVCSSPKSFTEVDIVRGTAKQKFEGFCIHLREYPGLCGYEANWFEQREEQDVPQ